MKRRCGGFGLRAVEVVLQGLAGFGRKMRKRVADKMPL